MVLDDLEVGWVHLACGTQVWITRILGWIVVTQ